MIRPPLHLLALLILATASAGAAEPLRIACIGDSITAGFGTKDHAKDGYPAQLGRLLGEGFTVGNFGVSGATLLSAGDKPWVKEGAHAKALDFKPDVVVIMLGTNDTKPKNWVHHADYAADYRALIDGVRAAAPRARIIACAPVPAFPGNFGITEEHIVELGPEVQRIAGEAKAEFLDLHAALAGHAELVPDKVHPNEQGAAMMAKAVYRALTGKDAP